MLFPKLLLHFKVDEFRVVYADRPLLSLSSNDLIDEVNCLFWQFDIRDFSFLEQLAQLSSFLSVFDLTFLRRILAIGNH